MNNFDKGQELQKELGECRNKLSSPFSDIGDWKMAKCQEYVLAGEECPYDIAELHHERQKVRDRINELEKEIEADIDVEDAESEGSNGELDN